MEQNGEKLRNDFYGESSFQVVKFHHFHHPVNMILCKLAPPAPPVVTTGY